MHLERAEPLADEMRGRREPALAANAARGEEAHPLGVPRNQPAASAASRASASSGSRQTSGPSFLPRRASQSAARKTGRSGSDTRAAVPRRELANARSRSLSASSRASAWRTGALRQRTGP